MSLKLETLSLPVVEQWDCHGCGNCCRGTIVPLDDDDLARIRGQAWGQHPDYQGVRTIVRRSPLARKFVLAQRGDGSCVFLTAEGRCKIHELHGADAKPRVCRMFPLQIVPLDDRAHLTMRRSCPSAAENQGRPLAEQIRDFRPLVETQLARAGGIKPPRVVRSLRLDWTRTRLVGDALTEIVVDTRYPLVRRLACGLEFCDLLSACRIGNLRGMSVKEIRELTGVLTAAASEGASRWFQERSAPGRAAATLFRQTAAEIARLHPRNSVDASWRQRLRMAAAAFSVARGKGRLPPLVPGFPETTYDELEQPLGPLPPSITAILDGYFESFTASLRYAALGYRRWSLVEGFRGLALSFPVALWLLRWSGAGADVETGAKELIPIIGCLDRSHGYEPLIGRRHRRRVSTLAHDGGLQHLLAWYAR